MKGLFRGLRCIFDTDDEKEPEIQIGAPTDVKHVAHIGADGPSTAAPSWMNDYQGGSEAQSGETGSKDIHSASSHTHKSKQKRGQEPRKTKSSTSESATNSKKTRKKKGEGSSRASKAKNKDTSANEDPNCSDGVCKKPLN